MSFRLTLLDWAKRTDPNGNTPVIAELLSQRNEILQDAVWKEGNLPTGERVVIRTGLPDVYYRALNQGIPNSKSTTTQVDEACAILEARSEIDKDLAMLNGNTSQFRLSEDVAFLEAMNQRWARTLFYGNPQTAPQEFLGLTARYSTASGTVGENVIRATTSAGTSVWLACWGENTLYCPFPKGSKAGLVHEDLGEQTVYDGVNRMQALSTRYQWKGGLVNKDWRYVVRICNLPVADLGGQNGSQGANATTLLIKLMLRALYKLPNQNMGRPVFYMNRAAHTGLALQAMDRSNGVLNIQQSMTQFGQPQSWLTFLGVPIRCCDAIDNTETVVPA
jgi:hypothetical protein